MSASQISNGQRAMWMVLLTSLAAPFFASLIEVAMALAGPLFDAVLPGRVRDPRGVGEIAIGAFAWGALPATLGALGLTPYVMQSGTYGWLHAAVAGVLAFAGANFVVPVGAHHGLEYLAFLSGLTGILMRAVLIRGRILKP